MPSTAPSRTPVRRQVLSTKTFADRIGSAVTSMGVGRLEVVLGLIGVALVEQAQVTDLHPLGPMPDAAAFSTVAGAGDRAGAYLAALDALGGRYPFFGEVAGPFTTTASMLGRHSAAFDALVDVVAATDLAGLDGRPQSRDLLGDLYSVLRSHGSKAQSGAFFTPHGLVSLLAEVQEESLVQGAALLEPACGTGSMFLGAAETLRRKGVDLWSCGFFGIDLDRTAVACCGLNAIIWGLGPHVWLHAGNGLVDYFATPDGKPLAVDVMLANPPFGKSAGAGRHLSEDSVAVVVDPQARRAQMGLRWPQ